MIGKSEPDKLWKQYYEEGLLVGVAPRIPRPTQETKYSRQQLIEYLRKHGPEYVPICKDIFERHPIE